jgi:PAS domain S-box-containing protein
MHRPTRILLLETPSVGSRDLEPPGGGPGFTPLIQSADSLSGFQQALADFAPDIVLCGHCPPVVDAFEALALVRSPARRIPFVVVAGSVGEETAVALIQAGADGFVHENNTGRLPAVIAKELGATRESSATLDSQFRELRGVFQTMLDSIPAAISFVDADRRYRWINRAFADWTKLPPSSVNGRTVQEICGDEFYESLQGFIDKALNGEASRFDHTLSSHKRGRYHFDMRFVPHRAETGKVLGYFSIRQDVTERRDAEMALRQSEAHLAEAQAFAHIGSWEVDLVGNHTRASEEAFRILGLPVGGRGTNLEEFLALVHPGDRPAVQAGLQRAMESAGEWDQEFRIVRPDGSQRVVRDHARVLRNEAGVPVRMIGIIQDITERHQAEAALDEKDELFRRLAATAHLVPWDADLAAHQFTHVGPQAVDLLGYPLEAWCGKDFWQDRLHPEDREQAIAGYDRKSRSDHSFELTYRMRRKDGGTVWVHDIACRSCDDTGRPVLRGVLIDITDRHRAEESLRDSEDRFNRIFRLAPAAICLSDLATGVFIDVNELFLALVNKSRDEVIGHSSLALGLWGEDIDARARLASVVYDFGGFRNHESTIHLPGGGRVDVSGSAEAVIIGGRQCVLSTFLDISARVRAETALREHHDLLDNLARQIPGMIYQFQIFPDGRARIPFTSTGIVKLFELDPAVVRDDASPVFTRVHPEDHPRFMDSIRESAASLSPWQCEFRVVLPQQGERWLMGNSTPEKRPDGSVLWHGFATDITEQKQMRQALGEYEKLAATGRMAARIAHEINNPLGGIKNCFHLLKPLIPAGHPRAGYLTMIEGEIERISHIISEMFNLYRPKQDEPRALILSEVVNRVVDLSSSRVRNAHVTVRIHAPEEIHVVQSEGSVIQIMFNLLGNAIEASPPGGTITIHLAVGDGMIRIAVEDDGTGVPEDLREKIFEPFFTTKPDRPGGGIGLGLSISRSLAEAMGGALRCAAGRDRGALFTLEIPVRR